MKKDMEVVKEPKRCGEPSWRLRLESLRAHRGRSAAPASRHPGVGRSACSVWESSMCIARQSVDWLCAESAACSTNWYHTGTKRDISPRSQSSRSLRWLISAPNASKLTLSSRIRARRWFIIVIDGGDWFFEETFTWIHYRDSLPKQIGTLTFACSRLGLGIRSKERC